MKVKKVRREWTNARTEIGLLVWYITKHKRSAEETERRLNVVQYELDGARTRVTQLQAGRLGIKGRMVKLLN